MPDDLVIATLVIPDNVVIAPTPALPGDWKEHPAPASLRKIGHRFIAEGQAALMLVPSVLVPQENNIMLNPLHPDATKMTRKRACPFPLRS
jgi:RES domain-containing protein